MRVALQLPFRSSACFLHGDIQAAYHGLGISIFKSASGLMPLVQGGGSGVRKALLNSGTGYLGILRRQLNAGNFIPTRLNSADHL
jgi:hypothetical protein